MLYYQSLRKLPFWQTPTFISPPFPPCHQLQSIFSDACPHLQLPFIRHPSIRLPHSKWGGRQAPEINICFIRASLPLAAATARRRWWMASSREKKAPCQFSTRWRVLAKRRMRDDGGVRGSECVCRGGFLCRWWARIWRKREIEGNRLCKK